MSLVQPAVFTTFIITVLDIAAIGLQLYHGNKNQDKLIAEGTAKNCWLLAVSTLTFFILVVDLSHSEIPAPIDYPLSQFLLMMGFTFGTIMSKLWTHICLKRAWTAIGCFCVLSYMLLQDSLMMEITFSKFKQNQKMKLSNSPYFFYSMLFVTIASEFFLHYGLAVLTYDLVKNCQSTSSERSDKSDKSDKSDRILQEQNFSNEYGVEKQQSLMEEQEEPESEEQSNSFPYVITHLSILIIPMIVSFALILHLHLKSDSMKQSVDFQYQYPNFVHGLLNLRAQGPIQQMEQEEIEFDRYNNILEGIKMAAAGFLLSMVFSKMLNSFDLPRKKRIPCQHEQNHEHPYCNQSRKFAHIQYLLISIGFALSLGRFAFEFL